MEGNMNESMWQIMQMIMWIIGIQTTIIIAILGGFLAYINNKIEGLDQKLSNKIDSLDEKITDVDRRLCHLQGAFSQKECCMIKDERKMTKAE